MRLWSLSAKAFARLANHGYAQCDCAIGFYLMPTPVTRMPRLPFQ